MRVNPDVRDRLAHDRLLSCAALAPRGVNPRSVECDEHYDLTIASRSFHTVSSPHAPAAPKGSSRGRLFAELGLGLSRLGGSRLDEGAADAHLGSGGERAIPLARFGAVPRESGSRDIVSGCKMAP